MQITNAWVKVYIFTWYCLFGWTGTHLYCLISTNPLSCHAWKALGVATARMIWCSGRTHLDTDPKMKISTQGASTSNTTLNFSRVSFSKKLSSRKDVIWNVQRMKTPVVEAEVMWCGPAWRRHHHERSLCRRKQPSGRAWENENWVFFLG